MRSNLSIGSKFQFRQLFILNIKEFLKKIILQCQSWNIRQNGVCVKLPK